MAKSKWLNNSIITGPHFCLCLNLDDLCKTLKSCGIKKNEWPEFCGINANVAEVHAFTSKSGGPDFVIVCLNLEKVKDTISAYSFLVHEAVHIWQSFCHFIGESQPSPEFEAYSIQRISAELMRDYDRQTKAYEVCVSDEMLRRGESAINSRVTDLDRGDVMTSDVVREVLLAVFGTHVQGEG